MKRYSTEDGINFICRVLNAQNEFYPKNPLGKCMVYFNMSHHYRRIYSAKPRVDTNLPKKSPPQFCCSSPDIFNFVRRNCSKQPLISTPRHRICAKVDDEQKPFKPKILDSRTQSKLKTLPVYEPPQKVALAKTNQKELTDENERDNIEVDPNIPDGGKIEENTKPTQKESNDISDENETKMTTPELHRSEAHSKDNSKYRPVDKSTVMFLKDVTDDILRKGIYTNKSLEKLFSYHMFKNKYSLSKDLMEKEIAKLKVELEMPVEDERIFVETSTYEDEEVLTALESLLLPADIRDQVATSLGLKLKSPPLPSPKDSFTGSLVLTSMSEGQGKMKTNVKKDTYSLKSDNGENKNVGNEREYKIHDEVKMVAASSDEDKTIADEEYPEEINSEQSSHAPEIKSEDKSSSSGGKNLERSDETEIKSETNSRTSTIRSDEESNSSEVKSKTEKQEVEGTHGIEESVTSDSESIHTETDE